ncbi:unnamed protein product [Prunus brigantina]
MQPEKETSEHQKQRYHELGSSEIVFTQRASGVEKSKILKLDEGLLLTIMCKLFSLCTGTDFSQIMELDVFQDECRYARFYYQS